MQPDYSPPASSMARRRRKPSPRRARPDGRTWVVRRSRDLAREFRARLGAVADESGVGAAVVAAAEMGALAENLRQLALRGEPIPADDVIRATRTADLLLRRLPLDLVEPIDATDQVLAELRAQRETAP